MKLSDEQIAMLPPDQKEQVLAIRAQALAAEAEAKVEAGAEAEEDRPLTSAAPEQSAMVQKIMKLSDEQIAMLPPDQKAQVLAIRAQALAAEAEAEAEASSAPPKSAEEKKVD